MTLPEKRPRMVVTDLDGTLLPASKQVSAQTRDVMGRIAALGVQVAVASGKFAHLARGFADQLGPETAMVALNGGRIQVGGKTILAKTFPSAVAHALLEGPGRHAEAVFAENGADEMLLRFPQGEITQAVQQWAGRIHRVDDVSAHLGADTAVMVFYDHDQGLLQEIAAQATGLLPSLGTYLFPDSGDGRPGLLLQPGGVHKGSGVLALCEYFGIPPGACMVFGDWFNDLPMFGAGFVNVAVANADPELKALAHHITERDNEHDGVAHFLEQAFL